MENKFGVRAFLKNTPQLYPIVLNQRFKDTVHQLLPNAFIVKSIYFDKPPTSNWIVNWHQDLTINVEGKIDNGNFKNWRVLKERTIVQPPIKYLDNIVTIRIHLDHCTKKNGALRVIPKSHRKGIIRIDENLKINPLNIKICDVNRGGILIMKPMILHSSKRTENNQNRRVIHIELSNLKLDSKLKWNEYYRIINNASA